MPFTHPNMAKAVEELGKLLEAQKQGSSSTSKGKGKVPESPATLEDDIADGDIDYFLQDMLDVREPSPPPTDPTPYESDTNSVDFSRFERIPIGTFWNSQRTRSKTSKKTDLRRAIKRTFSNQQLFQSTLLETLPPKKRKRENGLLSPDLKATEKKEGDDLDEDFVSISIPPPLGLS